MYIYADEFRDSQVRSSVLLLFFAPALISRQGLHLRFCLYQIILQTKARVKYNLRLQLQISY